MALSIHDGWLKYADSDLGAESEGNSTSAVHRKRYNRELNKLCSFSFYLTFTFKDPGLHEVPYSKGTIK